MPLVHLHGVHLAFAGPPLLGGVDLAIDAGERVGLLGRNGAGKSTLLRVLAGAIRPDAGDVVLESGARVAMLEQDVPREGGGSVRDVLHRACGVGASEASWEIETRMDQVAHDLDLSLGAEVATMSAGSRRRVLLAAALVRDPDVLLLDEPTNHLDIETIETLEDLLLRRRGALVFVTHDRGFLQRLSTRILDLDRGVVRSYPVGYDAYLERRADELRVEAEHAERFDRKLAEEEAWLRRGIKARRTRNEGRVRALEALRSERRARRDAAGRVQADLNEAERSGQRVLRARGASWSWGEHAIVRDLDFTVMRGDRVGLLGPNGCGKSTLLALLLGGLTPQAGVVEHGTRLEIAHFDQMHDSLDPARSVLENVADGRESFRVGDRERHVVGYLADFLFTSEQIRGPVDRLSGGERRRLQLAQVLSRPCNLLVLDEPTNDLDLETLELLEELLGDFGGTLLLVSHDRAFLDRTVTSTLAWAGNGRWVENAGGWSDWARVRAATARDEPTRAARREPKRTPPPPVPAADPARPRKLSYKEQRERDELPARIAGLEAEQRELHERMASPGFHAGGATAIGAAVARLAEVDAALEAALERWLELETLAGG